MARETPGSPGCFSIEPWWSVSSSQSLVLIGSGLFGPALGPLLVGSISDAATNAQISNGLAIGMLIVPVASAATGIVLLFANRRIAASLRRS
ncbi:hypothetical protein [Bradyrhizobium yuanmingense]|uniref:hypothetical protein n=1 Tax=Bradyrhizobium yuanmingense TaxID=108015 RepID=UPI0023B8A960|nr:hypothetical protein [Bradyrhizobium yuanmingense]MDF0582639.1 hypothetical protein [Bradyrhizobium yuanmingense]